MIYKELTANEKLNICGGMPSAWGIAGMICGFLHSSFEWACDNYQTVEPGYCEP